ncbi:serine hydrolase [Nonomuraea sp. NPDC049158]|uniref:serine hydrolase n=1 Tax=Nonomuraea sp. NPDC049158 TaxID=3155649 RepID=UPI0033D03F80
MNIIASAVTLNVDDVAASSASFTTYLGFHESVASGAYACLVLPVSTVEDYHALYRMLLNKGTLNGERILSRASVALMTMDHLTPEQKAEKDAFGDHFGRHGGFGFGMAVSTHSRDLVSPGQFGWDGGLGTTAYADPAEDLVGILLTQSAMDSVHAPRLHRDFWITAYQTIG